MAFDDSEGEPIALATAAGWTANYRATDRGTKAHFFGKDILKAILAQEGCMGIRIYYAINDEGEKRLILVGADADEEDQLDGVIADFGRPCPTECGTNSRLAQ